MSSTFRSTENWSHFVFWREKKQEEPKHAHDSCIYCTDLEVKPHDDLMGGGGRMLAQLRVSLSALKVNSAVRMFQVD